MTKLTHFIHKHFIWFLLGSYILAAVSPSCGLWMRDLSFGNLNAFGQATKLSLPVLMLGFLLWNAGFATQTSQLKDMGSKASALFWGLLANVLAPIAAIIVFAQLMRFWHNPDEAQNILAGLALVASMPIAGASSAWSQNAGGNLALSLGLILLSTLLSPLATPFSLNCTASVLSGDYAEDLQELAGGGTQLFLAISVIAPVLFGLSARRLFGASRVNAWKPALKLLNMIDLLLLNYANGSTSLPRILSDRDYDFLLITLLVVTALCLINFSIGWLIANWLKADYGKKIALMFGLGMNNNGTGLVLASTTLSDHPLVLLPIIFYTLVQNLIAGIVDRTFIRQSEG